MSSQTHLFLDESGFSYIGQPKYRFFILTALVIQQDQHQLLNLLFKNWKKKYLKSEQLAFHTADFFEDHKLNYKLEKLDSIKSLAKASTSLIESISHVNFEAKAFYIDVKKLRKQLGLKKLPQKLKQKNKSEYKKNKKIYSKYLKQTLKDKIYYPLHLTLEKSLFFHSKNLSRSKINSTGYINFESQSVMDVEFLKVFHRFANKIYKNYGEDLIGVKLHTKGALDSAIETADLISYIACQTLRFQYHLTHEYEKVLTKDKVRMIRKIRNMMRQRLDIKHIEVQKKLGET